MYCIECGAELPVEAKFCRRCGKRVASFVQAHTLKDDPLQQADAATPTDPLGQSHSDQRNEGTSELGGSDYVPIEDYCRDTSLEKAEVIRHIRDGVRSGRFLNGHWYVEKDKKVRNRAGDSPEPEVWSAAVGRNFDYYWRQFSAEPPRYKFNFVAWFFPFIWAAYRKLWGFALFLSAIWTALVLAAPFLPVGLVIVLDLAIRTAFAFSANRRVHERVQRLVEAQSIESATGAVGSDAESIAKRGGVSWGGVAAVFLGYVLVLFFSTNIVWELSGKSRTNSGSQPSYSTAPTSPSLLSNGGQKPKREKADRPSTADSLRNEQLNIWIGQIATKIQSNWIQPVATHPELRCEVRISVIPGMEVVGTEVLDCNGNDTVRRSIIDAIEKSSPLPRPPDRSMFENTIVLVFRPM